MEKEEMAKRPRQFLNNQPLNRKQHQLYRPPSEARGALWG